MYTKNVLTSYTGVSDLIVLDTSVLGMYYCYKKCTKSFEFDKKMENTVNYVLLIPKLYEVNLQIKVLHEPYNKNLPKK